jgi:oligosaccharide repeat unit polymerase
MSQPLRTLDSVPAPTATRARDPFATRTRRSLWIAGVATVGFLILLVAVFFNLSAAAVVAGIGAVLFLLVLVPSLRIAERTSTLDFFSPAVVFPLVYVVWYIGGSITIFELPSELPGIGTHLFDPVPAWMYFLYAAGLAAYFAGIFIGNHLPERRIKPLVHDVNLPNMQRIVRTVFVGAVLFYILTSLQFGIPLLSSRANATRLALHGPIYQSFMYLSFTALILSPILVWSRGGSRRYDWLDIYAVPGILSLLILSLGGRSSVICPLITILIARSYFKRQSIIKLAALGVVAFAIFSAIGYFREAAASDYIPIEGLVDYIGIPPAVVPFIYTSLYLRYTVSAFRDLTQIVPSHLPFMHGALTILPFSIFLPGHHDMSDVVFKKMLGLDFEGSGVPGTILAPLYLDWGWYGVVGGMCSYGVFLSVLYRRMKTDPTTSRISTYAWWLQSSLIGIYCNGYISILIYLLPVVWAVFYYFAGSARRTLAREAV